MSKLGLRSSNSRTFFLINQKFMLGRSVSAGAINVFYTVGRPKPLWVRWSGQN